MLLTLAYLQLFYSSLRYQASFPKQINRYQPNFIPTSKHIFLSTRNNRIKQQQLECNTHCDDYIDCYCLTNQLLRIPYEISNSTQIDVKVNKKLLFSDSFIIHQNSSSFLNLEHRPSYPNLPLLETLKKDILNAIADKESKEEMVDWISVKTIITTLPRKLIHTYNLYHRGMGVLLFNRHGKIFVHQRAHSKRVFPSMYDMFIGGVCSTKESTEDTLRRELKEELNIDISSQNQNARSDTNYVPCRSMNEIYTSLTSTTEEANSDFDSQTNNLDSIISSKLLFPKLDSSIHSIDKDGNGSNKFNLSCLVKSIQSDISISHQSKLFYLCDTDVLTSYNHCRVGCYVLVATDELLSDLQFADGEILKGAWLDLQTIVKQINTYKRDIASMTKNGTTGEEEVLVVSNSIADTIVITREDFVPDGLQVWDNLFVV